MPSIKPMKITVLGFEPLSPISRSKAPFILQKAKPRGANKGLVPGTVSGDRSGVSATFPSSTTSQRSILLLVDTASILRAFAVSTNYLLFRLARGGQYARARRASATLTTSTPSSASSPIPPKASAPTLPSSPVAAAPRSFPQLATNRAHQRYGDALPGEPITPGLAAGRHTEGVPIH